MKTEEILPRELLEKLYFDDKLSDNEIANKFNLSLGQVHRLRRRFNFRTLEQWERHPKVYLDDNEKAILIGLMLGDGHMRKRRGKKTYPQLILEQSDKHSEYIYWLKDKFNDWLFNKNKPIKTNRKFNKNANKYYHSLSFQTICHPAFEEIYNGFYKSGKKKLDILLLEKYFNKTSLAVWIMDDGCLSGKCRRNMLATNNFSKDEVNILRKFLEKKFGLKSWICRRTSPDNISYEIAFDKSSSVKIRNILDDIVIPSMKYKLLSETAKGTDENPKVQSDTLGD